MIIEIDKKYVSRRQAVTMGSRVVWSRNKAYAVLDASACGISMTSSATLGRLHMAIFASASPQNEKMGGEKRMHMRLPYLQPLLLVTTKARRVESFQNSHILPKGALQMAKFTSTMFVIAVTNLAKSAQYYQEVLGFTVHEIGDPGWRIFKKDECRIMAGNCPDAIPAGELGDHSYFAYINVEGIDEYYAQVLANGAKIIKKLRDEPWGMREFAIRTLDGHRIMFGFEIER
jgi:predicted enzyme related to lactoylglutathione lyase